MDSIAQDGDFDRIPAEMKALDHWVNWRLVPRPGKKPDKPPYIPGTNQHASSTNSLTWRPFGVAVDWVRRGRSAGVGFCLQDSGLVGLDYDDVRDPVSGEVAKWALLVVQRIQSYAEVSPSGAGLRQIARGCLPDGARNKIWFADGSKLELWDSGRYLTITSNLSELWPDLNVIRDYDFTDFYHWLEEEMKVYRPTTGDSTPAGELLRRWGVPILTEKHNGEKAICEIECPGTHGDYPKDDGKCFVIQFPDGAKSCGCQHASCSFSKESGNHWRELRERYEPTAAPAKSGTAANGRQSQISLLVDIGMGSELYHTPEGIPYARQAVDGHHEDWPTNSKAFREKLARDFHAKTGTGPGSQAVRDAIATLDGYARFEGDEHVVHVRVAGDDERIWLDLGNQDREVVEITAAGWSVITDPPVHFRRPAGMLPLPVPEDGGSSSDIKSFLNVTSDADWSLILSWCVTALRPEKPYPILYLLGEQGSAKSTATRVIRNLIDPFKAPLRTMPRDERDLFIAASNCRVLAFDNVSKLPSWLSDALCRLATGGGLATRALYTDCDEVLLDAMRPIVMNGIEQAAIRGDFLERAIMLELPTIVKADRRDEAGFWTQFKKSRPKTLGVVLDGVSAALRGVSSVNLESKPRMADFAIFSTAAEAGLGFEEGTFQKAYEGNRDVAVDEALEAMPISPYVMQLANTAEPWTGTFSELLEKLGSMCGEGKRPKYWPETPRKLSADMKRIAPALRERGIDCTVSDPGRQSKRKITLCRTYVNTSPTSPMSPTSPQAVENNQHSTGDVGGGVGGDVSTTAHTSPPTSPAQVSENTRRGDDGDVGDVITRHFSGGFEIIEEL